MDIPSYAEWKQQTNLGTFSVRSMKLRAVDSALEAYEKNKNNSGLKNKLISDIWIALWEWGQGKPGNDCRNSSRNRSPTLIVTQLLQAVNEAPVWTQQDLEIFRWQEEQRRLRVRTIFSDKQIRWKAFDTKKEVEQARLGLKNPQTLKGKQHVPDADAVARAKANLAFDDRWNERTQQGKAAGARAVLSVGAEAASLHHMILNICGGSTAPLACLGTSVSHMAADMIPVISTITSGAKLIVAWTQAAIAAWQQSSTHGHVDYLSEEDDIAAALAALERMPNRRTNETLTQATIQTADFATRSACLFVDFGTASSTAVGAVSNLAKLVHKLYLFSRELKEMSNAKKILSNRDSLGPKMFEVYPLLGCYMLCCSDTGELVALSRSLPLKAKSVQFGGVGWKYNVQYLKKDHIDPVLERAVDLIQASPFVIPNMAMHVKNTSGIFGRIGYGCNVAGATYNAVSIASAAF